MTKYTTLKTLLAAAAVLALCAGGCGFRENMRDNHGKQSRAWFAAQKAKQSKSQATEGLDSEEASMVHQNYRRSLGSTRQGRSAPNNQVVYVQGTAPAPRGSSGSR